MATIYTDSRYVFGVVHGFGAIWKHRNFLTSSGSYVAHHHLISELLDAIQVPRVIVVCKCQAHTNKSDPISLGNARADAVAKQAAQDDRSPEPHGVRTNATPCLQVSDLQA